MKQGGIRNFYDLETWRAAHAAVLSVYSLTKKFPSEERFGLTSQLQRAAVSTTSNIAEGFGRQTFKDKVHFYYMAQGSLTELENQLIIARDLLYVSQDEFDDIIGKCIRSHKLLQGLIRKSKTFV